MLGFIQVKQYGSNQYTLVGVRHIISVESHEIGSYVDTVHGGLYCQESYGEVCKKLLSMSKIGKIENE